MSRRSDPDYISDILECIKRASLYTETMNYEEFLKDFKTQDAVIRNIEILGEAVKALSDELKNKYPQIPWKSMAGTRDKLIHDYFGVNIDIVWNIIKQDLPEILAVITKIHKNFNP